ncbi:MAG: hypothetical protein Q9162_005450 [Coniocarpon cinnabarinum]
MDLRADIIYQEISKYGLTEFVQTTTPEKFQRIDHASPDQLPWKELPIPTTLDDYEGFYGVEEVDDVEVKRDDVTGQVTFNQLAKPIDENEEWEGFSDETQIIDGQPGEPDRTQPDGFEAISTGNVTENVIENEGGLLTKVERWQRFDLAGETLKSLASLNFTEPTPIQASTIPAVLQGRDVIGKAPTGSGKTLAFGIPIFERWLSRKRVKSDSSKRIQPVALIIEPARELAHQIEDHLSRLRVPQDHRQLSIATLTGGLSSHKQKRLLERADVIIATPGRLWDIMGDDSATLESLKKIEMLVVDEADRLLSRGHFQELELVLNALDRQDQTKDAEVDESTKDSRPARQTLVFSATFAKELQGRLTSLSKQNFSKEANSMGYLLQKLNFRQQPMYIDVNPTAQMATNLTEALLEVSDTNKDLYLYCLLLLFQPHAALRALVFVNSIAAVRRIVPFLQLLGFNTLALHSNMEQNARLRSVERFSDQARPNSNPKQKNNSTPYRSIGSCVLVSTDVAARGLDIPNVDVVIHYHLPRAADMYIHRSGRTARASAHGASILMAGANEAAGVKRLISQVHAEKPNRTKRELRIVTIEDRVLSQLRSRAELAKKIADVEQAKEKANSGDRLFQEAADDLGLDLEELDELDDRRGKGARGKKRKQMQSEALSVSKGEVQQAKAELKRQLAQRIKTGGVSERYLANGTVDIGALIDEEKSENAGLFLGVIDGLKLL